MSGLIQLEPTPENLARIKQIIADNAKLQKALRGDVVITTAEEEQRLIEAGEAYQQLDNYDLTPFQSYL